MYRERILIVNKFDIEFTAEISVFKFSEPIEVVKSEGVVSYIAILHDDLIGTELKMEFGF